MSDKSFIQRVMECLENRYGKRYEIWFEPDIFKSIDNKKLKWYISSHEIPTHNPSAEETVDNEISVHSAVTYRIDDIDFCSRDPDEERKIREELQNRESWEKHKRGKLRELIAVLAFADKVAEDVSERTEIKVLHFIPNRHYGKKTFFCAMFDAKNLSDEQKMDEIQKLLSAVDLAFREFEEGRHSKEKWEQFIKEYFKKAR